MDKFVLLKEETVLLIVDIQARLTPAMKYGEQVITNTNKLISFAQALAIPIIVTEQYPKGLGPTVSAIKDNLEQVDVFEKVSFTAYIDEVKEKLAQSNRKKIILTGMETHVCVFQTARDLLMEDYQVFLAQDALCSRTKENHRNGLDLMAAMGAVVTNTESIFFDLIKKAGTPTFKELSKLIK